MSLLGSDALGHWALGHPPDNANQALPAATGSFAVGGQAATFSISEAVTVGPFALTGISASFSVSFADALGVFNWTGNQGPLVVSLNSVPGAFVLTGYPANEPFVEVAEGGTIKVTFPDAVLTRTGFDYDFQQGGIGHYLEELERARQLARITRNPGVPIDRRTRPRFQPIGRPLMVPPAPAPDVQAIARERMAAQMAVAAAQKKRRDEEALLLLAC